MTSTLAVNADGTLPYTRDATGRPVIKQPIIDSIVNESSVALALRQIGPYAFAWNSTLDLDGSWHTLLALDPGTVILRTWAVFDADFDVADQAIGITLLSGVTHAIG